MQPQEALFGKNIRFGVDAAQHARSVRATIFNLGRFAVMQGIYRTDLNLIASEMTGTAMGYVASIIITTTTGTTTTMPTRAGTG